MLLMWLVVLTKKEKTNREGIGVQVHGDFVGQRGGIIENGFEELIFDH